MIRFICAMAHSGEDINRDAPTITINERLWAYCPRGGITGHAWQSITPMTIDQLEVGLHNAGRHLTV